MILEDPWSGIISQIDLTWWFDFFWLKNILKFIIRQLFGMLYWSLNILFSLAISASSLRYQLDSENLLMINCRLQTRINFHGLMILYHRYSFCDADSVEPPRMHDNLWDRMKTMPIHCMLSLIKFLWIFMNFAIVTGSLCFSSLSNSLSGSLWFIESSPDWITH